MAMAGSIPATMETSSLSKRPQCDTGLHSAPLSLRSRWCSASLLPSGCSFIGSFGFSSSACSHYRSLPKLQWQRAKVLPIVSQAGQDLNDKMIVSITGATGFVGRKLVQRLLSEGHKVRVLTRSASNAVKYFPGIEIAEEAQWADLIQGSTAVINLAGNPISTRWSPEVKAEIMKSRVDATSKVVEAINAAPQELRPSVLVSATAIGFYGTSETQTFDELSPSGADYLSRVCREWESTAQKVDSDVRLVLVRIGIVLESDGGALAQMIPLFKLYAGGPIGSGKQWFSWVHRDDLVGLIMEALKNSSYRGVINGTAPNPVRFSEMCDQLGAALGRPSWLPVPAFMLQALLGEGAQLVVNGQRVIPKKALELGFKFKYKYVSDALKAIVSS
ncbi:hypothetical protein KP509_12G014400 [Ceratopteris richardii]|uniref:Epimerase family protein SDR39U1 homolog, chloroplastic n=1 Tax=Ceratopteris richardii TaxID=49495 RepID=A0A8T2TGR8_CERRI|nr:hypothetical protein KP509_12G014400 [Ceratopteris richardii]